MRTLTLSPRRSVPRAPPPGRLVLVGRAAQVPGAEHALHAVHAHVAAGGRTQVVDVVDNVWESISPDDDSSPFPALVRWFDPIGRQAGMGRGSGRRFEGMLCERRVARTLLLLLL
jgi:hypothetical protein